MLNETLILSKLESMETLASMLLKEAAEGRKLLQKETKPKSAFELEVKREMAARKVRVLRNLNKKALQ